METKDIKEMNQFEFTEFFKEKVTKKLVDYFGEKLNTKIEPFERSSHAYTFCITVMNSIGRLIGDYQLALYKIDDANEIRYGEGFPQKERERLINDLENCENVVLFLVDILRFK